MDVESLVVCMVKPMQRCRRRVPQRHVVMVMATVAVAVGWWPSILNTLRVQTCQCWMDLLQVVVFVGKGVEAGA